MIQVLLFQEKEGTDLAFCLLFQGLHVSLLGSDVPERKKSLV